MKQEHRLPVIVLDGPAGAGKSSVARELAARIGVPFLDTGAIYRGITWWLDKKSIVPQDGPELECALRTFSVSLPDNRVLVCGVDVTSEIRTPRIDQKVSSFAALKGVRDALLSLQRDQAALGLVAEGRDMGTIVFPNADLKIFLTASPEERAKRRYQERLDKGESADYEGILKQVIERDNHDSTRNVAPLRQAEDALLLDSTGMPFDVVVAKILQIVKERGVA